MSGNGVDFFFEALLHLPKPADLDACTRAVRRLVPHGENGPRPDAAFRMLMAEYDFPEGKAAVYAMITTQVDDAPERWRAEPGAPMLSVTFECRRFPRSRAGTMAQALLDLVTEMAETLDASGGYFDLGSRQNRPEPATPWATFRRVERSGWARILGKGKRLTVHRRNPFPDGFADGEAGFPPKPKSPVPACIVVAGVVLKDESPASIANAKRAGLRVWRAEFVIKPPCVVAGLLIGSLTLSEFEAYADPNLVVEFLGDARERLQRMGHAEPVGLLMVRVMDSGGL